jgi:hypothetical protein
MKKIPPYRLSASRLSVVVLSLSMFMSSVASAHHGFGNFAMNEDIELTGVITKVDFVNPHAWLHFDVTNADGTRTPHRCELRSATTLRRSGWTPAMFPAGMKITIQGSPDRTEPNACYTSTLTFSDGSKLDRYGQRIEATVSSAPRAARLPNGVPNLAGNWAQEQLVMTDPQGRDGTLVALSQATKFGVGGLPEGQREIPGARGTAEATAPATPAAPAAARPQTSIVALTPAGQAAMETLAAVPRAQRSCTTGSIVSDWSGEPVNHINQDASTLTLQYGFLGLQRSVHLDQGQHPAGVTSTRAGHSIGHWEGDVLVVDTVGFLPGALRGVTPHSAQLHVVERFALDPATQQLRREYTADDPLFFTATYKGADTLSPSPVPYNPEPCQDLTPTGKSP